MEANPTSIVKAVVHNTTVINNQKIFAVILYRYSTMNGEHKWEQRSYKMDENNLVQTIKTQGIEFINVAVEKDRIVARGAQLSRFDTAQAVVIGVMTTNTPKGDKVIGYRFISKSGMIKAAKISDVIEFADKYTKEGKIPFQNAMYVPAKEEGQTGFLRAYNEGDFITERRVYTEKAKSAVDTSNVQKELGGKAETTKKLQDIYTNDQLRELRIGKNKGLPIRIYANPKLTARQMAELRDALEKNINPQRFANPAYSVQKMKFFKVQLLMGKRINEYLNPEYSLPQMIRILQAIEMGLDVKRIRDPKMTLSQMDDEIVHMELELYNEQESTPGRNFKAIF